MSARSAWVILAFVLLAWMGAHRYATVRRPAGVEEYHANVRAAVTQVPAEIGGWVGKDIPVPPRAIRVLDPNAIVSRQYTNVEKGDLAGLLLVHCADAHDMVGHFPVRCYKAAGWDLKSSRERDWVVGDLRLTGMEYVFVRDAREAPGEQNTVIVANCLLRPGGQVLRDMNALSRTIVGAGGQASGAGQVQVYFDPTVLEARRDAAVVALVQGYRPVIDAILAKAVQ